MGSNPEVELLKASLEDLLVVLEEHLGFLRLGRINRHAHQQILVPRRLQTLRLEKVEEGAYQDAEFLRPYEERSHEVHVEEGSQLSAQLDLIPAERQPQ